VSGNIQLATYIQGRHRLLGLNEDCAGRQQLFEDPFRHVRLHKIHPALKNPHLLMVQRVLWVNAKETPPNFYPRFEGCQIQYLLGLPANLQVVDMCFML